LLAITTSGTVSIREPRELSDRVTARRRRAGSLRHTRDQVALAEALAAGTCLAAAGARLAAGDGREAGDAP